MIFYVCKVSEKEVGPLAGVVICVGKKLSKMQGELNAIAASLGADFRYSTHVIFLIFLSILAVKSSQSNFSVSDGGGTNSPRIKYDNVFINLPSLGGLVTIQ